MRTIPPFKAIHTTQYHWHIGGKKFVIYDTSLFQVSFFPFNSRFTLFYSLLDIWKYFFKYHYDDILKLLNLKINYKESQGALKLFCAIFGIKMNFRELIPNWLSEWYVSICAKKILTIKNFDLSYNAHSNGRFQSGNYVS